MNDKKFEKRGIKVISGKEKWGGGRELVQRGRNSI